MSSRKTNTILSWNWQLLATNKEYLVKGIAGRKFARQFVLSDTVVVRDANLADGILSIELENVIPEEQKPRKITIK